MTHLTGWTTGRAAGRLGEQYYLPGEFYISFKKGAYAMTKRRRSTSILIAFLIIAVVVSFSAPSTFASTKKISAPYALKAKENDFGSFKITWKCKTKGVRFQVYRKKAGAGSYKKVLTTKKKSGFVKVEKKSYFKVRAIKGNRCSKFSKPIRVETNLPYSREYLLTDLPDSSGYKLLIMYKKNKNDETGTAFDGHISVWINNNDGTEVYVKRTSFTADDFDYYKFYDDSGSIVTRYCLAVDIPFSEIKKGTTPNGTLSFMTRHGEYVYDKVDFSLPNLPVI
jgi:hypothetical protein